MIRNFKQGSFGVTPNLSIIRPPVKVDPPTCQSSSQFLIKLVTHSCYLSKLMGHNRCVVKVTDPHYLVWYY